jgi:hypothetical protein
MINIPRLLARPVRTSHAVGISKSTRSAGWLALYFAGCFRIGRWYVDRVFRRAEGTDFVSQLFDLVQCQYAQHGFGFCAAGRFNAYFGNSEDAMQHIL